MRTPDWQRIREEFPAIAGCTFLDTASYGQTPRCAVDAIMQHFERRNQRACSDFLEWFDDADEIRSLVAALIHSQPEDIAFVHNASSALSWLFNGIGGWKRGDRILTLAGEFPNNLYFPATLNDLGVEFIEAEWEQLQTLLDERVRLVLLSSVNYITGFSPNLDGFAARVREAGGILYVDGTQSVGALQFDVGRIQPDMLAVHGYKWLLSPNGAGFAYVSPRLREMMRPTVMGWRSHRSWRDVDNLHHGAPEFAGAAERYEGGMLNFPSLYAMGASIEMMLDIGPALIEDRVLGLAAQCGAALRSSGAKIAHEGSQIISAHFDGIDASALAQQLKRQGIHVSARHGGVRISTHFYNNEQDLQRLVSALEVDRDHLIHAN